MRDEILDLARGLEPLVEFEPPASEEDIESAERALGIRLPDELRTFLRGSDGATIGVMLPSGEVIPNANPLVWSVAEITHNHRPQPPDLQPPNVLFFANAGADGVCLAIRFGRLRQSVPTSWCGTRSLMNSTPPRLRSGLGSRRG